MINSYAYRADSNFFSFSRRGACWHETRSTRLPVTRKFQQLRRKLNNSEPTTQLRWNHRDDFNIINGTGFVSAGTNFSARRLPLSKLTRFFLRPLLNRILEVRPRYISRWHRELDRPHSTLHFVELFAFLLSSLLFFFCLSHYLLIGVFWEKTLWQRLISIVTNCVNQERLEWNWKDSKVVVDVMRESFIQRFRK